MAEKIKFWVRWASGQELVPSESNLVAGSGVNRFGFTDEADDVWIYEFATIAELLAWQAGLTDIYGYGLLIGAGRYGYGAGKESLPQIIIADDYLS